MATVGCTVTGPGQRGVRISMGSMSDDVQLPGVHMWVPFFSRVHNVDVQVQRSDIKTSAASKDMQDITTELALNWSLDPKKVVETFRTLGDESEVLNRIIAPAVSEVLKAATAQHGAEDILKNRMVLKKTIDEGLKERLAAYGVALFDVSITHLSFTSGFEKAIEEKQIAEQKAKQASYDKDRATQEGQAEFERAKGTANAQAALKASLTKEMLQQRAIDKWDGHFPQVMGPGALPFINLKMQ